MAYDPELALRLRNIFLAHQDVTEKKMFGGLADRLMARVGPDAYQRALGLPHASPMDFTGRPLKGLVYVDTEGIRSDEQLRVWVGRAVDFVVALPPK